MVCRVAVLNSFMMVDASPVTHIVLLWKTNLSLSLLYVQKISLLLVLVAMDVVSGRTNQVQDII